MLKLQTVGSPCPFCKNQGINARTFALTGRDAVSPTLQPGLVRAGCANGHKFAAEPKA